MDKLSEPDINARLESLKGWDRLGDMLVKTWQLSSARRALDFVNRVAELAEQQSHYPDVILSFRDVRVELSTHSVGGLTEKDFALAATIDQIPVDR